VPKKDFWARLDLAIARFAKVLLRLSLQFILFSIFGLIVYGAIAFIPNSAERVFYSLFFVFSLLYVLFTAFAITCLITKFQERKVLPPGEGGASPSAATEGAFSLLWKVERFLGISSFPLKDRYRYWSFMHYLCAIMMFLNATYCLTRLKWMVDAQSGFLNSSPTEIAKYTIDLVHKGIIISDGISHFGMRFSKLPFEFHEFSFQAWYFFVFKITSAILLIGILTMLFEPALFRFFEHKRR
jgi:hypothetical protein